ncbi:DMT family transporter [Hespellia stercorisuis]|uniref:Permease of the drug/metabolite transporter (DMT) superfamily n=1 Tax=Hespellia stercorisuis DSM 15480 TaxID=1121950 RepID=A0A1M6LBQ7_9FIRM|nr:DMT family transporter [Hespellia stercorisuis]SHJ68626.1 Permease of the drug/metabolite transporter (DMT) superfamily [Hespellia stercorisuis DSM 15480]
MTKLKTNLLLLLTAFIWGMAFVAQKVGMDYVGPFTFNALRSLIGVVALLPVVAFLDRQRAHMHMPAATWKSKELWIGGLLCGIFLCLGSTLQQFALMHSSVGKVGFITTIYILFVPILGLFLKKRVSLNIWIGVLIALAGMYLLCITENFSIAPGDLLALICALAFAFQILIVDHFSPRVDGVRLSCIQFLVCSIICSVGMFAVEAPKLTNVLNAWMPLLYAGVLSCGVAYTLQIVAQKHAEPTIASLIMSLESVFSVIGGWLLLGQVLSVKESFGCVLVFAAVVLAQMPAKVKTNDAAGQ